MWDSVSRSPNPQPSFKSEIGLKGIVDLMLFTYLHHGNQYVLAMDPVMQAHILALE
jgi:hypothetical protein